MIPLDEKLLQDYIKETQAVLPNLEKKRKEKTKGRIVNIYGGNLPIKITQTICRPHLNERF